MATPETALGRTAGKTQAGVKVSPRCFSMWLGGEDLEVGQAGEPCVLRLVFAFWKFHRVPPELIQKAEVTCELLLPLSPNLHPPIPHCQPLSIPEIPLRSEVLSHLFQLPIHGMLII